MWWRPSLELGALQMAKVLCTALRDQDEATALRTLFEFTTPQGRVALAPPAPQAGRRSSVDEATFVQTASHPLLCLLGCDSFRILGEPTVIPPTQTREGLATVKIEVNPSTSSACSAASPRPLHPWSVVSPQTAKRRCRHASLSSALSNSVALRSRVAGCSRRASRWSAAPSRCSMRQHGAVVIANDCASCLCVWGASRFVFERECTDMAWSCVQDGTVRVGYLFGSWL